MKKTIFLIIVLVVGVIPLFAHPGVALPDWLGTVVLTILGVLYVVFLGGAWKIKFLRYLIIVIPLIVVIYGFVIESDVYKERLHQKDIKKKERLHQKDIKEKENKAYVMLQIEEAWKVIDDEKQVIKIIDSIKIEKDEYLTTDVERKVSALYMALAIKTPLKKEFYKSKSEEINRNTCLMTKELLPHIKIKDEPMILEILSEERSKSYDTFDPCIPYAKETFVKILLKNKQFEMLAYYLNNQYFNRHDILNLLLEFKWLEDDDLRKKMMTILLENYRYVTFDSFSEEMEAIFEDGEIFEYLQDFKGFNYYVDIMTKRLGVAREEGYLEYNRNPNALLIRNYKLKENFLKMTKILDDNSSFMQEIPAYIKNYFYEEALKDKEPKQYALFERIIDTDLYRSDTFLYNLYVDGKKVHSSLLDYRGYVRYRFKIKDKGKKVVIEYKDNNVTEILEVKEKITDDDEWYWIIDKEKEK